MAEPNFKDQTVWIEDNLNVMRGMNSECVDLLYLDPPFNSNRDYAAPIGSVAAGAAFKDTWTLSDVDLYEHGELAERNLGVYDAIGTAGITHGKGTKSYLIMMAVRLLEMRRILKPKGTIYLHCDPEMSHYLKMIMDAIFGRNNFRSEIIWKRTSSHNLGAKQWPAIHDVILMYSQSDQWCWNTPFIDYDEEYAEKNFRYEDKRGKYSSYDLTGGKAGGAEAYQSWRGVKPSGGRAWALPKYHRFQDWLLEQLPEERDWDILGIHQKLDLLDSLEMIHWPEKKGGKPRLKNYLINGQGSPVGDIWTDIKPISARAKERTGYPTQKPLALLKRIIMASSNQGDLIFDPFCGCATALVVAHNHERRWVGCDLSPLAAELVDRRIRDAQGPMFEGCNVLYEPPHRTDLGELPHYREHRHYLYGKQEGFCAGCGHHFMIQVMEVDHMLPQSRGGQGNLENLQLLCSGCNRSKGTRTMAEWNAAKQRET